MYSDAIMGIIGRDPFLLEKKIEETAEYIVLLEKLLEENGIIVDDDLLKELKKRYFDELKEEKRRFLMQFAGEIIREEG